MNKKYALVTVTRNSNIIMQLLADLTVLDLRNMEQMVIVDNGSSKEFISELKQSLNNIKSYYPDFKYTLILREYNYLFSRSNNFAIEYILKNKFNVKYIILINPDISIHSDYWINEENPFEHIIDNMIDNNAKIAGVKLLYGNGVIEHAGGKDNSHIGHMQSRDNFSKISTDIEWVTGALMVIDVDTIKEIGYLDEINCPHWASDQEYCRRATESNLKILYSPVYFIHAQGRSTEKESHYECNKDLAPGITWESTVHCLDEIKTLAIKNSKLIPLKLEYSL